MSFSHVLPSNQQSSWSGVRDVTGRCALSVTSRAGSDPRSATGDGYPPDEQRAQIRDAVEASDVVAELQRAGGRSGNGEIADDPMVARRMLELLLGDQDTRATAEATLADPPAEEQLSVETTVITVAVLAAAISWLQTKVIIKIDRKDGKTNATFELRKNAAAGNSLERLATLLYDISNGPSEPGQ